MIPPTLTEHLAVHLRWWDWLVIVVNLAAVALCLVDGDWAAAFTSFVIGVLYTIAIWFMREAHVWRATTFTLLDVLTERERQQR